MRLSPEQRAALLADLKLREALSDKALMQKHKVSRATLWRVLDEDREMKQFAPDIARRSGYRCDMEIVTSLQIISPRSSK